MKRKIKLWWFRWDELIKVTFCAIIIVCLLFFLLCKYAIALEVNEKYSHKDFTNQGFSTVVASEFNNSEIVGSCFYQELADDYQGNPHGKRIFPVNMMGVVFKRCNLDNVILPAGAAIEDDSGISNSQKKIRIQNDLEDWIVNNVGNPIEPVHKERFQALGLSIDPNDIPETKRVGKSVTQEAEEGE